MHRSQRQFHKVSGRSRLRSPVAFRVRRGTTSADFAAAVTTFGSHSSRILVTWAAKWRASSRPRRRSGVSRRRRTGAPGGLTATPAATGAAPAATTRAARAATARLPGRKPGDTSRAVAEAARRAAWSVGKLFLVLQRDRRRDHSPQRMPPPALIHVCVKKPQLRKWQGAVVPERTLILVKPDAVRRNLIGEVISRIERKGLKVVAMDLRTIDSVTAESHYAEHAEKPFFGTSSSSSPRPAVALVAEGARAIEAFRARGRGHRPGEGARQARSAATTRWRSGRTSCTAPTPLKPPSGKLRSSSLNSFNHRPGRTLSRVLDRSQETVTTAA